MRLWDWGDEDRESRGEMIKIRLELKGWYF